MKTWLRGDRYMVDAYPDASAAEPNPAPPVTAPTPTTP
jgi:hypothetical protein